MDNETVTLKLTAGKAFTLRMVLDFVGGDLVNSPRKHTQAIVDMLIAQGVPYATEDDTDRDIVDPDDAGLYFKDYA